MARATIREAGRGVHIHAPPCGPTMFSDKTAPSLRNSVKFWLAAIAIAVGIGLFKGDIGSGVVFVVAAAAVYAYWIYAARSRRTKDKTGP